MKKSHLRLVAFDPNDYSLGEVLVKASQDLISDPKFIGSALSLVFQWPEKVMASAILKEGSPVEIHLDYDRDERAPTELRVIAKSLADLPRFVVDQEIRVRLEVFRQCYEFVTRVLAVDAEAAEATDAEWHLIIETPSQLFAYRHRRLPRIVAPDTLRATLPPCAVGLVGDQNSETVVDVVDMGMKAIKVRGCHLAEGAGASVRFGETRLAAKIERHEAETTIISLLPQNAAETGAIFDFYRLIAMPGLVPRSDFSVDSLLALYRDTHYFGKFQTPDEVDQRQNEIKRSWTAAGTSHNITADYVITDGEGQPSGASSASYAFKRDGKSVWALHQLCAKTNPNLLEQSGQLYTWRAEYLAARSENLSVIGWFDSRSRWLERIYVKFAFHKYKLECLHPITVYRKSVGAAESRVSESTPFFETEAYGETERVFHDRGNICAGLNPHYLNASGILNAVIDFSKESSLTDLCEVASALVAKAGHRQGSVEFTTVSDQVLDVRHLGLEPVTDVDRMFYFDKDGLVDFIASVEHSVAVTLKKKSAGEFGEAV